MICNGFGGNPRLSYNITVSSAGDSGHGLGDKPQAVQIVRVAPPAADDALHRSLGQPVKAGEGMLQVGAAVDSGRIDRGGGGPAGWPRTAA